MNVKDSRPFESADVSKLVGIRPVYLNKFVERGLYGIAPSARPGDGRGTRRWFSLNDVFGIALVWWLFEAGLRTEVIRRVLCKLGNSKKADANLAAKKLYEVEPWPEFLLITRDARLADDKSATTPQKVRLVAVGEVLEEIQEPDGESSVHSIPVKTSFLSLIHRLDAFKANSI